MNRAEALNDIIGADLIQDFPVMATSDVQLLVSKIFDEHEAQLKLASDVYSTDKMHMYQELKAKGKITQDIKEAYELKSIAYDLLLEAIQLKDEEIERLKVQLSSVHNLMYRNGYSDAIDCYDTFGNFNTRHKPNAKARSIVAMLFWEWRKSEARIYATNIKWNTGRAFQSQILFEAAYKILKEQQ